MARSLAEVGLIPGVLACAYAVALAVAVVYLGEHYAVDVLAGLVVAEAVRKVERLAQPVAERLGEAVAGLERLARAGA